MSDLLDAGGYGGMNYLPSQSVQNSASSGSGSSASQSSSAPQMIPGMMGVYNQLLGQNTQHYGNVLGAYQQGQANLSSNLPGVYGGYAGVQGDVMNTLGMGQVLGKNGNWGVAAPAAQAIGQAYAQQRGSTTQQMTNAGLGNTTAVGNAQNQNALGYSQAIGGLGAQLAQTAAGYQSQIGQAGLGARMQGLDMQSGLTQGALGPLGSQFSNTAGQLAGQASQSTGSSQQSNRGSSEGTSQGSRQYGGGGSQTGGAGAGLGAYGGAGGREGGAGGFMGGGSAGSSGLGAYGDTGASLSGGYGMSPGGSGFGSGGSQTYNFGNGGGNEDTAPRPGAGPNLGGMSNDQLSEWAKEPENTASLTGDQLGKMSDEQLDAMGVTPAPGGWYVKKPQGRGGQGDVWKFVGGNFGS